MSWNQESIKAKLLTDNVWLERAVVALYKKQTQSEKAVRATTEHNGVGYNYADARLMSYYATWILSGKKLSGHHLEKARNKILKYTGQLTRIANGE